jgi:Prokaryotic N-terminal methylation motif
MANNREHHRPHQHRARRLNVLGLFAACRQSAGLSLVEVMIAMVILAFSILGVTAMFQWGEYGLQQGNQRTRALALAEARVEAKRAVPWEAMLEDDVDFDGIVDVHMGDDGAGDDEQGGDGVYTGTVERDGVRVVWTVEALPAGPLSGAGIAIIKARASYWAGGRWHAVDVGALRANPAYVGSR